MESSTEEICRLLMEISRDLLPVPDVQKQLLEISELYNRFRSFFSSDAYKHGNHTFGVNALKYIQNYCSKLKRLSKNISKLLNKYRKGKLKSIIDKLLFLAEVLPHSYSMDENDFSALPENHPRKQAVRNVTKTITESEDTIKRQLEPTTRITNTLRGAMYVANSFSSSKFRNLFTVQTLFNCYRDPKYYKMQLRSAIRKGDINALLMFIGAFDSPLLKTLLVYVLKKPRISKSIFVPRLAPLVTDEFDLNSNSFPICPFLTQKKDSHVQIQIISPTIKEKSSNTTLVIFVHGGAHIGMSTFTHQPQILRFSNFINLPIFSIEYRLAPADPFPAGLDDVWQAYVWLVTQSESQLGIVPTKVILYGDSVGGNMMVGITLKARQCGFRVPDGLLAIYPLLNHVPERVSLGTFLQLEDRMLDYSVFRLMRETYVKDKEMLGHYLVSPLGCDGRMLEGFPKIRFVVTLNDPLFMDSFRFADRLLERGCDVGIYEYCYFPHGALAIGSVVNFRRIYSDMLEMFNELIS